MISSLTDPPMPDRLTYVRHQNLSRWPGNDPTRGDDMRHRLAAARAVKLRMPLTRPDTPAIVLPTATMHLSTIGDRSIPREAGIAALI